MGCQITYNKNNEVVSVRAPNMRPSILYSNIQEEYSDLTTNEAVEVWAESYTPGFINKYRGKRDENGEAVFKDARPHLLPVVDEIRFSADQTTKARAVASNFNMEGGFITNIEDSRAVSKALKQAGVRGIQVKSTPGGKIFFTQNGSFYDPFNETYLGQSDQIKDWQLGNVINELLTQLGVTVEWSDELAANVKGQADVLNRIIKLAEGRADERTLTREMMHVIVSMMRGTARYNAMASEIKRLPIYKGTRAGYSQFSTYDEGKIVEEAMVNHLSDVMEDEASPEARHWWNLLLDWLKRLITPRSRQVGVFRETAKMILEQDLESLSIKPEDPLAFEFEDEIWFEIEHVPEAQDAIGREFDAWNAEHTMDGDRHAWRGKTLRYRSTDKIARLNRELFGLAEFAPEQKKLYTTKGTILHMYYQLLMEDARIFHETGVQPGRQSRDYENAVYNHLKDLPEFEGLTKDYYKLNPKHFNTIAKGVSHLYQSIMEEDPNARIYLEQFIPLEEEDLGGVADVVVVHGDGTLSMYDYKNVKMKRRGRSGYLAPDTDDRKLQLYDAQLSIYKRMLEKNLNLSHENFRQIRIIPVNIQYDDNNNVTTLQMGHPKLSKRHLRQITASHEFVPGDTDLNTFMEKLYNERTSLRNQLKTAKGKEKKFIEYRLGQINDDISDLIVEGDVNAMLEGLGQFIQQVKKNVKTYTFKGLNNVRNRLEMYESFPNGYRNKIEEIPDEEYKAVIQEKMRHFTDLLNEAQSMVIDESIHRAQMFFDPTGKHKITEGGRGPSLLSEIFEGLSKVSEPVTQTLFKLFREQEETMRLQLLEYEGEINKKHQAYVKWAVKNGHGRFGTALFDPLINKKTGNLITAYNKEFYDKKEKIFEQYADNAAKGKSTKEQVQWMQDHMEFDEELWKENVEKERKSLEEAGTYTAKKIKQLLARFNYLNPMLHEQAWFTANNHFVYKIKSWDDPIMHKYVSDEWRYVMNNEPAREFYEMYVKYNRLMGQMIGYDHIRSNTIGHFRASFIEKLTNWGIFTMNMGSLLSPVELREMGELHGATDHNGNPINRIPIVGVDELFEPVTDREKIRIGNEMVKEGFKRDTIEFDEELERRARALGKERGRANKSYDLVKSLKLMLHYATRYKLMSDIEEEVMTIRSVLDTDRYKQVPTDNFARRMYNVFTQRAQEKQGASPNLVSFVDTMINMHLYGRRLQGKDLLVNIGGKQYSSRQLVERAHEFLSFSTIALNPIIAGANSINAANNQRIQGKRKRYFTNQAFKDSVDTITSVDDKALRFLWFMEPTARSLPKERAVRSSQGFLNKTLTGRWFYALHRGEINKAGASKTKRELTEAGYISVDNPYFGDDAVGNAVAVAMAKTWVLDSDGRIKNPHDPFHKIEDPEAKTLYEIFQHENLIEDFSAEMNPFEGLSKSELARFRALILRAQSEIKGSTSQWDYSQADSNIVWQLMKKFRDWIPPMASARFEGLRHDPLADSYTQGYFTGTWKELMGEGKRELMRDEDIEHTGIVKFYFKHMLAPTVGRFLELLWQAMTFNVYEYKFGDKRTKRAEYAYNRMLLENPELDRNTFTFEGFVEFRKNQIRAAATEVRYVMMTYGIFMLIAQATDWDDDDNTNILTRYIYQLAQRSNLELTFWFSPQSVTDILKSPLPVIRLVTDTQKAINNFFQEGAEAVGLLPVNRRDKTPMFYYTMKRLPVLNQILNLTGYFPSYNGKEGTLSKIVAETMLKR